MSFEAIGFLTSGAVVCVLALLFRYEARAGHRILESARIHLDFVVLKTFHGVDTLTRYIGRDLIRQILHYTFHTLLRLFLLGIKKSEHALRKIMQVNRTLAKNAEKESTSRSRLEEIALHKVASALTENEKKKRKEKTLNGF